MLKYLFLLLPLWGSAQGLEGDPANPGITFIRPVAKADQYIKYDITLPEIAIPITSYTAAQTGAGHAEIYWPEGATHAVVFIPGKGERSSPDQLYTYNSPINWIRNGERPKYAVIAFSPGAYSFVSVNNASYLRIVKFFRWLKTIHPEWQSFSPTGLSYGAADWYNYIKYTTDADYISPYSSVLLSITSESQCADKTKLCGTDTRFKNIKFWAMDARNDTHHDKMKRYTDAMIAAGYPAKWTTGPNKPGDGHCCWQDEYSQQAVKEWLAGPVTAEPPAPTVNAGRDTAIAFPVDSIRLTPTVTPGADIRYQIISTTNGGYMDGSLLKGLYKSTVTVRVYAFLNGKQAYDDVVVTATFDPEAVFTRFKLGNLTMVVLYDGRIMQEF